MSEHYVLNGHEPVVEPDLMKWARMFEDREARRVALAEITDDIRVSTVFLGIDHSFGRGRPLLFETMVFGGVCDQEQERYSTWDDAERGHEAMVTKVRAALPQPGDGDPDGAYFRALGRGVKP